jgi:hypothetical protein
MIIDYFHADRVAIGKLEAAQAHPRHPERL